MLVFKMDTTSLFKNGQKHELRISLPRDKHKSKSSSSSSSSSTSGHSHGGGGLFRRGSLCLETIPSSHAHHRHNHHHHSNHHSNHHTSHAPRRSGSISGGSLRHRPPRYHYLPDARALKGSLLLPRRTEEEEEEEQGGGEVLVKEVRFALDGEEVASRRRNGENEGNLSEGSTSTTRSAHSRSSGNTTTSTTTSSGTARRRRKHKEGSNRGSNSSSSSSRSSSSHKSSRRRDYEQPAGSDESAHGLVTIRIKPDEGGKFGFNVKGGADQKQPVLVSRVAPDTPADRCYPRLNEGDQVLLINGRDVSAMSHEQVVNFIRASRECHSGELVLTVKQNDYIAGDDDPSPYSLSGEHPVFGDGVRDLRVGTGGSGRGDGGNLLEDSMHQLVNGLETGQLVAHFEQLDRRKPGLSVSEARRPENEKKNRYRDISPYDSTRVVLEKAPTGDYINASKVDMEVQGSGIRNLYIACQGPLAGTSADFWMMVWEQQSTLIVMLTTVFEQGRVKCHRYWPRLHEKAEFGSLRVTCIKETETEGFAYREFTLVNSEEGQAERHISHMQYLAWPDHGVPDDSTDFLNFVTKVRKARDGMVEPTIVHCSAGIGRTGVLILMETAQCLIEANQPVDPLELVCTMREQRAMMIQTASQFKFVCEAINRVYLEGLVKPLEEYQQR